MNKNDHRKVIINAFDERYKNDINILSQHPLPRTHIFSPCKINVATLWRFYFLVEYRIVFLIVEKSGNYDLSLM